MFCNWEFVEQGQSLEQMCSDFSSAIDHVASKVDQLAIDAFHDLVFLSVEVELRVLCWPSSKKLCRMISKVGNRLIPAAFDRFF